MIGRWSLVVGLLFAAGIEACDLPQLKVSENKRFLQTVDGKPFFWLADTAWEIFHRTTREEAIAYLDHRAANEFTVIQAVALAEFDGLMTPNAYGHTPLANKDPTKPSETPGAENDYWDHVDFVIAEANKRGMYVGLLPSWGDKWNKKWGVGPEIFTPENAERYGEWIGKRYANTGVVWIMGGDRPTETDLHRAIIRAMAKGVERGSGGKQIITFHPVGGNGSSTFFPDDPWISFHMRQNGHGTEYTGKYDQLTADYQRKPTKPVLDGEPIYEDHPISFDQKKLGHSIAADVRRAMYWDLFQGACGHTYGHHSIWQFASSKHAPVNNPLMPWTQALTQPGGMQMKFGRRLIESRPFFSRVPDQSIIVAHQVATSIPGAGRYQFVASRDEAGSYAFIYAPVGRTFRVNGNSLSGSKLSAHWYNPRNGNSTKLGTFNKSNSMEFSPPDLGESLDWILVLDDADKNYPPPGTIEKQ